MTAQIILKNEIYEFLIMNAENILNNAENIKKMDVSNMADDINKMSIYIKNALNISKDIIIPKEIKKEKISISYGIPQNIIVIGMGGSAIGGNLLKEFLFDKLNVPIEIIRDYNLPKYVSETTLVIVISYSGNTEESLNGFKEALEKKAMIVAISSNGLLSEMCNKNGIPIVMIPENIQPRASLPYLFFPLLNILRKINIPFDFTNEIDETISILNPLGNELHVDIPLKNNLAKQIASKLHKKIGLIYAPPRFGAVARRMKCQLNENSKNLAFWDEFSELNHNEIVGWERKLDIQREFVLILIRSEFESMCTRHRIEITKNLIYEDKVKEIIEIKGKGKGLLSQIFSLILIGDYVSLYLAFLNGIDPSPVKDISKLKKELKDRYDLTSDLQSRFC